MTHTKARQVFRQICAIWDIEFEEPIQELVPEEVNHDIYAVPASYGKIPRRRRPEHY